MAGRSRDVMRRWSMLLVAVPVLGLVGAVESLLKLFRPGIVHVSGGHVEAHFVALPGIATVGEAAHKATVLRHGVALELGESLRSEIVEAGL